MKDLLPIHRKVEARFLEANAHGRDFIMADIHGHYTSVLKLMAAVGFNKKTDRIFCSGDLVDRGPDPVWAASLTSEPWFNSTLGNHDLFMVRNVARRQQNEDKFRSDAFEMGGAWTLAQDQGTLDVISSELQKLPHILSVGQGAERFNVVHGIMLDRDEFLTDHQIDRVNERSDDPWLIQDLTENRKIWRSSIRESQPGLSLTYCGHTPLGTMAYNRSHLCLDFGAGHPDWVDQVQRLAFFCHQDKTLWTIKTNDRYAEPEKDTQAYSRLNIEPSVLPMPDLPKQVHLPADLPQRLAAAHASDSRQVPAR